MEVVDAKNIQCPMPIVKLAKAIKTIATGEKIQIEATDLAFEADISAWCEQTQNSLINFSTKDGVFTAIIQKK